MVQELARRILGAIEVVLYLVGAFLPPFYTLFLIVTRRGSVMTVRRQYRRSFDSDPQAVARDAEAEPEPARTSGASGTWSDGGEGRWRFQPKSIPNLFLSPEERERIVEAIRRAEDATSVEFRVHVERKLRGNLHRRVRSVFHDAGMEGTTRRNAVLVYIALLPRRFMLFGDLGIGAEIGVPVWREGAEILETAFRRGQYAEGLCRCIEQIGTRLRAPFPSRPHDNELPDDVSLQA